MKHETLEVFRGSGNVYRDSVRTMPTGSSSRALMAGEIIKALDKEHSVVMGTATLKGGKLYWQTLEEIRPAEPEGDAASFWTTAC